MKSLVRLFVAFLVALVLAACGGSPSTAGGGSPSASSSAKTSASPTASSKLDPEVPMPKGFPSDVPIYPGARLTAAASFSGSGQTTWGMEWETLDGLDKVKTFYSNKLSQGDWNIQFSSSDSNSFSAVFNRKSNANLPGIVGADASSGVTKISMSLASASS